MSLPISPITIFRILNLNPSPLSLWDQRPFANGELESSIIEEVLVIQKRKPKIEIESDVFFWLFGALLEVSQPQPQYFELIINCALKANCGIAEKKELLKE